MRIDSSGNLLVSNTSADISIVGHQFLQDASGDYAAHTSDGTRALMLNRKTSDGEIIDIRKDSVTVGSIGAFGGDLTLGTGITGIHFKDASDAIIPYNVSTGADRNGDIGLGSSTARFKDLYLSGSVKGLVTAGNTNSGIYCGAFGVYPAIDNSLTGADNVLDLGQPSYRWDDVYATNGTIQTSDEREKQDIDVLSEAEHRVAVACKGLLRKFRWKDSVAEKGDDARIHFGIIAQDLQAAFAAEGLDAGDYAMFIHSTWTDEETGEERDRMGVRYPELLAFIIAAL